MAVIGLTRPFVAKYGYENGTVSYTDGIEFEKAVSLEVSINASSDNNLYANNGIAETDRSFSDGTLTLGTDDLTTPSSALILGITPTTLTVDGEEVTELVYDDNTSAPYLGLGIVITKKHQNAYRSRAVVFTKIMFSSPGDSATTRGESISWQTPQVEATIMRDDSPSHRWKREATFDTEEKAVAYIKSCLGIQTTGG